MSQSDRSGRPDNIKKFKRPGLHMSAGFRFGSSRAVRLTLIVFLVLLFSYGIYQAARLRRDPTSSDTKTAQLCTITRSVTAESFVLREETPIRYEGTGVVVPAVSDGVKVPANEVVAYTYATQEAAAQSMRRVALQNELMYLKSLEEIERTDADFSQEIYDRQILSRVLQLQRLLESDSLASVPGAAKELGGEMTRKTIAMGGNVDVASEIARVNEELTAMNANESFGRQLKAECSGVFMSVLDGFEGVGDYDSACDLTVDEAESLIDAKPSPQQYTVGKLVTQFAWYLICVVDEKDAVELETGDAVKVLFSEHLNRSLELRLKTVNRDRNGKCVLVFFSTEMDPELLSLRQETVKLCIREYVGIPVEKDLVRTQDDQVGVFVKIGSTEQFAKLNIIYQDESIVLSANETREGYLRVNHEILVGGEGTG